MFEFENLGNLVLIIASSIGILWTIIQISEWYKKGNKPVPKIRLEYDNDYEVTNDGQVTSYFLKAKNIGNETAQNVEIRLNKVVQENGVQSIQDRYIIGKFDYITVGDSHRFKFIQEYVGREGIEDCLLTPAGRDRKFKRENGEFEFLISGTNFDLMTVKMKMVRDRNQTFWQITPVD